MTALPMIVKIERTFSHMVDNACSVAQHNQAEFGWTLAEANEQLAQKLSAASKLRQALLAAEELLREHSCL